MTVVGDWPAVTGGAVGGQARTERITFEHSFFARIEGGYFRLSDPDEQPVYVMDLGGNEVAVPFPGIMREFGIDEESPDAHMLELTAQALNYVKALRIGDTLPQELLTGKPSWKVSACHRRIAFQRLEVQLVTWHSGSEVILNDADELARVAERKETTSQVTAALAQAAERLDLKGDCRGDVACSIQELVGEMAAIMALRDLFAKVRMVQRKIAMQRKLSTGRYSTLEILTPVHRLITKAVRVYQEIFDEVDAQTGEIIGVLRNIQAHVEFIRSVRDDLYRRLRAWEDIFDAWERFEPSRRAACDELLRQTYHFLAPRFMETDEWVLVTKSYGTLAEAPLVRGGGDAEASDKGATASERTQGTRPRENRRLTEVEW